MERNINELLTVVLGEYDMDRNRSCLCYTVSNMEFISIITFSEFKKLIRYIQDNKPFSFGDLFGTEYPFYWRQGRVKPRVKWLKKHIKLTSKIN